jgi:membrane-associated phospholipid phosphatase
MLIWLLLYFSRAAERWTLVFGLCIGLTALLKIVFYGCPPAGDMHSPSGHTGLSTLVYGALTLVTATAWSGSSYRVLVIAGGGGLILAIGVSRLLLEAHSVSEVGLGLVIGSVSLALFSHKYLRVQNEKVWYLKGQNEKVWPLLVAAGILLSILHGRELDAERFLHRIAGFFLIHCG